MTDNEIIKAMYYCRDFDNCNLNCPFCNKGLDCASIISKYALDLINRQKAEIDGLQRIVSLSIDTQNEFSDTITEQKAEIERLQKLQNPIVNIRIEED